MTIIDPHLNDDTKKTIGTADESYRFEHFSIKVMLGDMRFSRDALGPGQPFPDRLVTMSNGASKNLYQLADGKPLLLVTGSITCPMTVSSIDDLNQLQAELADKINVVLVYVREAHPGENFPQPQNLEQKIKNAHQFQNDYDIDFPCIIDELNGPLHHLLDVLPNSAHLISSDGEILTQALWMGDSGWLDSVRRQVTLGSGVADNGIKQPAAVSQQMLMPFLKGAGYIHDTLKKAGDQAYKELVWGAPPVSLLSRTAALFTRLPRHQRGLAALASIIALFAVMLGLAILVF
ncbi:MAG: hypothetical protein KUG71_00915 [Porticoccaceae bacterium]|nr:hypothetical protein [Porticoccaceae bacterium]